MMFSVVDAIHTSVSLCLLSKIIHIILRSEAKRHIGIAWSVILPYVCNILLLLAPGIFFECLVCDW